RSDRQDAPDARGREARRHRAHGRGDQGDGDRCPPAAWQRVRANRRSLRLGAPCMRPGRGYRTGHDEGVSAVSRTQTSPAGRQVTAGLPGPGWLEPQLATLTRDRISDPAWIYERKL